MKRYVVFFTSPATIKGAAYSKQLQICNPGSPARQKQITIRRAKGPIDAYRKATGWKGPVGAGKGYSKQVPARSVQGFHRTHALDMVRLQELYRTDPPPPSAYIVPLGRW